GPRSDALARVSEGAGPVGLGQARAGWGPRWRDSCRGPSSRAGRPARALSVVSVVNTNDNPRIHPGPGPPPHFRGVFAPARQLLYYGGLRNRVVRRGVHGATTGGDVMRARRRFGAFVLGLAALAVMLGGVGPAGAGVIDLRNLPGG